MRRARGQRKLQVQLMRCAEALAFYANPDTWFAVGMLPDPPCGEIMDDFSEPEWSTMYRPTPGKRARIALGIEKEPR